MKTTLIIEQTLARGGQGLVATTTYDGKACALKIDYQERGTTEDNSLKKEFDVLSSVSHDNVLKVYKYIAHDDSSFRVVVPEAEYDNFMKKLEGVKINMTKESDGYVIEPRAMLILELCLKDDLFDILENAGGVGVRDFDKLKNIFG